MPQIDPKDERLTELVAEFVSTLNAEVYDGKLRVYDVDTLADVVFECVVSTVNKNK